MDTQPVQHQQPESFGELIDFGWHGGTDTDPTFVRHLLTRIVDTAGVYNPDFDIVGDLNENPWRYEDLWSPWKGKDYGPKIDRVVQNKVEFK